MTGPPPTCRACPAPVLWATMSPSGSRNPLNVDQVDAEVRKGVFAYNPRTRKAISVTAANILQCVVWAQQGVTFHTSHFATCPKARRFRDPCGEHGQRQPCKACASLDAAEAAS